MLPPPPASRQASYAYPHGRRPSFAQSTRSDLDLDLEEDEEGLENGGESDMGDGSAGEDEEECVRRTEEWERERGLEETLEKLGFGAYHWRLLALCGFGWMSDNSALQCIAVILPRVQIHYDLSSKIVGLLSASTMAGMMIGAVGWGTISDLLGRALPFNATLFLTAVFGIGASFAPNFGVLCAWMFLLGSAVGGSMPTDGTLFLENLPHSKQYLLTLLSVFFSLGAVLSSLVSYVFLPGASCVRYEGCDVQGGANDGWRRVLFVLGLCNLACAFARWFLFRLHESPRYLVSRGREADAVVVLQSIAEYNNHDIDIQHADVAVDQAPCAPTKDNGNGNSSEERKPDGRSPFALDEEITAGERSPLPRYPDLEDDDDSPKSSTMYDSVGIGPPPTRKYPIRTGSAFYSSSVGNSPVERTSNAFDESFARAAGIGEEEEGLVDGKPAAAHHHHHKKKRRTATGGIWEKPAEAWGSWKAQIGKLFVPKWRRTVILMWIIWGSMSFSYTMFNVWLPAVLEDRAEGEGDQAIRVALKEFVLYSLAGCPGSIVGAWMIQTRLGRRKSLALCTLATALSTFAFIKVKADWAVIVSSMIISAAATAMYAVLYGMTPETFGTSIRGTACGTSAALSRLTGIIAPVTAGFLLTISPSLPVFVSAAIFVLTAACSLALPFERVSEIRSRGAGAAMH